MAVVLPFERKKNYQQFKVVKDTRLWLCDALENEPVEAVVYIRTAPDAKSPSLFKSRGVFKYTGVSMIQGTDFTWVEPLPEVMTVEYQFNDLRVMMKYDSVKILLRFRPKKIDMIRSCLIENSQKA